MTRRLIYRPGALVDLDEIAAYTRREWGASQAKNYVRALVDDVRTLRISATRHPLFGEVYPDLHRKRSGMHHIYYLTSDERVEIIRIIHIQRDPGRLLNIAPPEIPPQ